MCISQHMPGGNNGKVFSEEALTLIMSLSLIYLLCYGPCTILWPSHIVFKYVMPLGNNKKLTLRHYNYGVQVIFLCTL